MLIFLAYSSDVNYWNISRLPPYRNSRWICSTVHSSVYAVFSRRSFSFVLMLLGLLFDSSMFGFSPILRLSYVQVFATVSDSTRMCAATKCARVRCGQERLQHPHYRHSQPCCLREEWRHFRAMLQIAGAACQHGDTSSMPYRARLCTPVVQAARRSCQICLLWVETTPLYMFT